MGCVCIVNNGMAVKRSFCSTINDQRLLLQHYGSLHHTVYRNRNCERNKRETHIAATQNYLNQSRWRAGYNDCHFYFCKRSLFCNLEAALFHYISISFTNEILNIDYIRRYKIYEKFSIEVLLFIILKRNKMRSLGKFENL